jgi:hypothetical protein
MTYNQKYWLSSAIAIICFILTGVTLIVLKTHPQWYYQIGLYQIILVLVTAGFFSYGLYASLHLEYSESVRYQLFARIGSLILFLIWYFAVIYFGYYDISTQYFHYENGDRLNALDFFYFSASTFATVGYGDITASTTLLRLIVTIQIFLGIFVLILVIANSEFIYNKVLSNRRHMGLRE